MAKPGYRERWNQKVVSTTYQRRKARTILDIGKKVTKRSSVTLGDTMNVLYTALEIIGEEILEGYTVRLDGLGSFTVMAKSTGNGVGTAEEVNESQISGLRIRFLPSGQRNPVSGFSRDMFENVSFERIDEKTGYPDEK